MLRSIVAILIAGIALGWCSRGHADEGFFREKIAPIFEARCVSCHQGDKPKGGLSLTSAKLALRGGDSGAILEPGKPEDSLLLDYISGDEPEMPKGEPPLTAGEVELIREWITSGAKWPENLELIDKKIVDAKWWSLGPLEDVEPPATQSDWVRTPIDRFILKRLSAEGLSPSGEADRRTLIRRLTFDLHGLPPTPQEVDAFIADERPDAYEQLVDRLLASPRYGERWARHWLDVVHYGESHGYDKDKPRPNAWPYRDYVIASLNADKPYPRFIQEQLAGDVLWPDDLRATVATGFIAAGPWDFVGHMELREGTSDKEIARSNDRDDMVATTMSTFTSLTVHCARCHNHKFDPIPQQDYYRLQAVFAGVDRTDRPYDADPGVGRQRRELLTKQQILEVERAEIAAAMDNLIPAEVRQLEQQIAERSNRAESPSNGYHSEIMPTADSTQWVQVDLGKPMALDRVRLVPARPTDFSDTPGFGFPQRFKVEASDDPEFRTATVIADYTNEDYANPGDKPVEFGLPTMVARYVRVTATRLWPRTNDYVFALGELEIDGAAVGSADATPGRVRVVDVTALSSIEQGRWSTRYLTDGFDSRRRLGADLDTDAAIRQMTAKAEQLRVAAIPGDLVARQRANATALAELSEQLKRLPAQQLVYAAANGFTVVGNFSAPKAPRPVHLLARGDVKMPKELMTPGAVGAVAGPSANFAIADVNIEAERRVALANWLSDPSNALVRRSIVNRVWHYHFGQGIVDSPNDFGRMGSLPSHPELLEWLAAWFISEGESLKKLHRLIVSSATYRQASSDNPVAAKLDSGNRLLWRMNRQRLDAESVRDAMLAATGKLDLTMGGPSVQQFFFKDDHSPVYDYTQFDVDDPRSFRRSIYRFIVRSVPDPLMDCLDSADPSQLTPKRNTTLTAIQALAMLNNRFAVRQSEHLAVRVARETADVPAQVALAYRLALQRNPSETESRLLADYAERHGLASACRVVLNSNEFMFVD